ncbi:hypothetical protein [Haloferula rosea]|uniref:Uncharacterized protein n=1 Tax=Haloferula rosea TaxID=490093 RepID=A0A934RC54_9BACT|nr:hypothetical protein [Haloferula rosea]MBK1827038.1 hypothetical protein [Haloferula rosea]
MQLTRFDRWLREKFVHETHIYSLRPPEFIPTGIQAEDLPEKPGTRFRHRYVARDTKSAMAVIDSLKEHNQMFTTRVVDRKAWYVRYLAPEGKSVTWWCAWLVLFIIGAFTVGTALRSLWLNPTFRENFDDAIRVLQG